MKTRPHAIRNLIASISSSSNLKTSRSFMDLLADRIRLAASTESTMSGFINRLTNSLNATLDEIHRGHLTEVLTLCGDPEAERAVLAWLRSNASLAAMLAFVKKDECEAALDAIRIDPAGGEGGQAPARKPYAIAIRATAETPISHGSDQKSGNSTLFRRIQVITETGALLELPYIAGNAVRGQLRDIIGDNFARGLGLTPRRDKPPFALWFFHALYSGGALSEGGKEMKAVDGLLGVGGSLKTEGLRTLRDTLPMISLLGCAMTNRIIPGRIDVGDLRPVCYEWSNGSSQPVRDLMTWTYLTRREDHEEHKEGDNSSMIANTECLRPGTVLEGGIDLSPHISEIESSCLGDALESWTQIGTIGAQNARGLGRISLTIGGAASGELYREWLSENRQQILALLTQLGAIDDSPGITQ
jgi:hypothetical protein